MARHVLQVKETYHPCLLIIILFGWWIATILVKSARSPVVVASIIVWFFILLIIAQYVPNRVITKPVGEAWSASISTPFFKINRRIRFGIAWVLLLALVLGSAFGNPLPANSSYGSRAQSVFGLLVFQSVLYLSCNNKSLIQWHTIIVGLGLQQIIALFVLKTSAGFDLFNWVAKLAGDFLAQAYPASAFFWTGPVEQFWFIATTLPAIIFFIAFAEMCYHAGILQWVIRKFGWVFLKTLDISGAEAVVAAASPFIGQGESACLVKPYVNSMTSSEIHQMLTSGFATIAGSVLAAYINFGMPPVYLVTSAIMSIPAAIAVSKLRWPEADSPMTKGKIVVTREGQDAANALHAFSNGAYFGLRVAGLIFCNVLTILALVYTVNGLLAYIGSSFNITDTANKGPLSLELIASYVFYPVSWLMGVPQQDLLRVSGLLGTKLVANEFVAYQRLQEIRPYMTERGFKIAVYALCGFANLGSLGIQIGVLAALGPKRKSVIASVAFSALACGFLATCQTATIAGMLL